jgi:hypothetical protein
MTLREACALTVGMLGTPSTSEVFGFLRSDGWQSSREAVKRTLSELCGGPVARLGVPRPGPGSVTRWRLTEAGRAWGLEGERCGS